MLCVGVVVMVLGTYANLSAADDIAFRPVTQHSEIKVNIPIISKIEDRIRVNIPTTGKYDLMRLPKELNSYFKSY